MLVPIEALHKSVVSGAIALSEALLQAREIGSSVSLGADDFHRVAKQSIAEANGTGWLDAAILWRLVLEALADASAETQNAFAPSACSVWYNIAVPVLCIRADARLMADVRLRFLQTIKRFLRSGDERSAAFFMHGLGVLSLDPYIHTRVAYADDRADFLRAVAHWAREGEEFPLELGLPAAPPIPDVATALNDSILHLKQAASLRSGRLLGLSLKALVGAEYWRDIATGKRNRPRVIALARQALELLRDPADAEAALWLRQYLMVLERDRGV